MNEHLNIEFNTTDNMGETIPESIRTERVFQGGIDSSANRSSIGSKKKKCKNAQSLTFSRRSRSSSSSLWKTWARSSASSACCCKAWILLFTESNEFRAITAPSAINTTLTKRVTQNDPECAKSSLLNPPDEWKTDFKLNPGFKAALSNECLC